MTQINPYIGFNGSCIKAMNFYKECLGGELMLQTIGDSPMATHFPENMKDQILHSSLTNGAVILMGTDCTNPAEGFIKGNNIALSITCSSEEEINTLFIKLSEGGNVVEPVKLQFWGAMFGMLKDKFGIGWMLNYDKNQQ